MPVLVPAYDKSFKNSTRLIFFGVLKRFIFTIM